MYKNATIRMELTRERYTRVRFQGRPACLDECEAILREYMDITIVPTFEKSMLSADNIVFTYTSFSDQNVEIHGIPTGGRSNSTTRLTTSTFSKGCATYSFSSPPRTTSKSTNTLREQLRRGPDRGVHHYQHQHEQQDANRDPFNDPDAVQPLGGSGGKRCGPSTTSSRTRNQRELLKDSRAKEPRPAPRFITNDSTTRCKYVCTTSTTRVYPYARPHGDDDHDAPHTVLANFSQHRERRRACRRRPPSERVDVRQLSRTSEPGSGHGPGPVVILTRPPLPGSRRNFPGGVSGSDDEEEEDDDEIEDQVVERVDDYARSGQSEDDDDGQNDYDDSEDMFVQQKTERDETSCQRRAKRRGRREGRRREARRKRGGGKEARREARREGGGERGGRGGKRGGKQTICLRGRFPFVYKQSLTIFSVWRRRASLRPT